MGHEDGTVALGGLIGPRAPKSTQFNRRFDQEAAPLLDCGARPRVYRSGPDLPCRQHACFLRHQASAGGGGTGSVISLGVLLTMVSGLQGGR